MRRFDDQKGASDLAIVILLVVMAGFVAVSMITNWNSERRKEAGRADAEWRAEQNRKKKEHDAYLRHLEEVPTNQRFR